MLVQNLQIREHKFSIWSAFVSIDDSFIPIHCESCCTTSNYQIDVYRTPTPNRTSSKKFHTFQICLFYLHYTICGANTCEKLTNPVSINHSTYKKNPISSRGYYIPLLLILPFPHPNPISISVTIHFYSSNRFAFVCNVWCCTVCSAIILRLNVFGYFSEYFILNVRRRLHRIGTIESEESGHNVG